MIQYYKKIGTIGKWRNDGRLSSHYLSLLSLSITIFRQFVVSSSTKKNTYSFRHSIFTSCRKLVYTMKNFKGHFTSKCNHSQLTASILDPNQTHMVNTPMDPNHKNGEVRLRPQKWAGLGGGQNGYFRGVC